MIRIFLMGLGLVLLASCGADGVPTAPAAKTGVSIGGTVSVGVTGS